MSQEKSGFVAAAHSKSADGLAQSLRLGRHSLVSDEPAANGGKDDGPAPFAFVLGGLAACTAMTLELYARRKQWTLGSIAVDLAIYDTGKHDGHRVERKIRIEGPLTDEQRTRLLEIADKTPVTKLVRRAAEVVTTLV